MADFLPHLRLRTLNDPSMKALPAELTIDILSRLPVRTIMHCKLVCNKWRNLVLDSFSVNRHLSGSVPTGIIVHHNPRIYLSGNLIVPNDPGTLKWVKIEDEVYHHHLRYNPLLSLDLNLAPILQNTRMGHVGSVNCLISLRQYYPDLNFDGTYICNTVTREYMTLPRQRYRRDGFAGVVYGFGMSSLTGKYKVVQTFQTEVLEAEVYTLGKAQWRSLGPVTVPIPYSLNTFHLFYGPFLNNHCHWIVSDNEICTFDLGKETFQLFPSPPPVKENRFRRQSLAILKGCLCKLDTYHFKLKIWVMKEYGIKNSWHKEVVIRQDICRTQWPMYEPIHLIAGLKDGSILMVFENKLCVFDPRRKTIEDTEMFDRDLSGWAYRPSFFKLQNFESERVHMF